MATLIHLNDWGTRAIGNLGSTTDSDLEGTATATAPKPATATRKKDAI